MVVPYSMAKGYEMKFLKYFQKVYKHKWKDGLSSPGPKVVGKNSGRSPLWDIWRCGRTTRRSMFQNEKCLFLRADEGHWTIRIGKWNENASVIWCPTSLIFLPTWLITNFFLNILALMKMNEHLFSFSHYCSSNDPKRTESTKNEREERKKENRKRTEREKERKR